MKFKTVVEKAETHRKACPQCEETIKIFIPGADRAEHQTLIYIECPRCGIAVEFSVLVN